MLQNFSIVFIFVVVLLSVIAFSLLNINTIVTTLVLNKLRNIEKGSVNIIDATTQKTITSIGNPNDEYEHCKVYVHDIHLLCKAIAFRGEVGLGETYADGIWDANNVTDFVLILLQNKHRIESKPQFSTNANKVGSDHQDIQHHYDLGNDFYQAFLTDSLMCYTCAFWFNQHDTLESAQINKVNTIIRKLNIQKQEQVLDVGCGWGAIADYVQQETGASVHGLTISHQQAAHIKKTYPKLLVHQKHYNDLPYSVKYDKIYIIGMIEHVRQVNYANFFRKMADIMKPGARMLLHTITMSCYDYSPALGSPKRFATTHIFPGGQIPTAQWIYKAANEAGLKLIHTEVYAGHHYAKTLAAWQNNLNDNASTINHKYSRNQIRGFNYYFSSCRAAFLEGNLNVTHFVFDKVNNLKPQALSLDFNHTRPS